MKKNALIICAHDGFTTHYCGVGTVVRKTLDSLKILLMRRSALIDFELHFITPWVDRNSGYFDTKNFKKVKTLANVTGGALHEIRVIKREKNADINTNWGIDQWHRAAQQAADIIKKMDHEKVIFFAHDIFFGLICYLVPRSEGVAGCFIPHSTGILFKENFRLPTEKKIFLGINKNNYKIGYLNEFMKDHLQKDYHIKTKQLVSIKNALLIDESEDKQRKISLQKSGVYKRKKLILSFGRCSAQKGYHILIEAFKKSKLYGENYQLVLLAPTDITEGAYIKKLDSLLEMVPKEKVIWIKKFMPPRPFLVVNNLEAIVFASLFECAPLAPLEALRNAPNAKIIYSDIEPFQEIFLNLAGTHAVVRGSIGNLIKKLDSIPFEKTPQRSIILESYENNFINCISQLSGNI